MLLERNRLKERRDFQRVFNNGQSMAGKFVVVYCLFVGHNTTRFGFSVSKKVGNAVVRNRVKRILRDICRRNLASFRPGMDLIFIARPRIKGVSSSQVERDLMSLAYKMRLVKERME